MTPLRRGEVRLIEDGPYPVLAMRPHVWKRGVSNRLAFSCLPLLIALASLVVIAGAALLGLLEPALLALGFLVGSGVIGVRYMMGAIRLLTHHTRIEFDAQGATVTEFMPWRRRVVRLDQDDVKSLAPIVDYEYWVQMNPRSAPYDTVSSHGSLSCGRGRFGGLIWPGAFIAIAGRLREVLGIPFPLPTGPCEPELPNDAKAVDPGVEVRVDGNRLEAGSQYARVSMSVGQGAVLASSVGVVVMAVAIGIVFPREMLWPVVAMVVAAAFLGLILLVSKSRGAATEVLEITPDGIAIGTRYEKSKPALRLIPAGRIIRVRATGEAYSMNPRFVLGGHLGDSAVGFDLDDFTSVYFSGFGRVLESEAQLIASEAQRILGLSDSVGI